MKARSKLIATLMLTASGVGWPASPAEAQITISPNQSVELGARLDPVAKLEEQLVNRLRATLPGQREYLRFLVDQVKQDRLSLRLVVAVERYALRRNPRYPFPFFERAMSFEARKRNVSLPSIQHFRTASQSINTFFYPNPF